MHGPGKDDLHRILGFTGGNQNLAGLGPGEAAEGCEERAVRGRYIGEKAGDGEFAVLWYHIFR